jgi:tetratricopeptide (TPR) repeat protein
LVRRLEALRSEAATRGADDFAVATILNGQLSAEMFQGRLTAALDAYRAAVDWAQQTGKYELQNQGSRLVYASTLYALDRIDEALEAFQVADEEARLRPPGCPPSSLTPRGTHAKHWQC